MSSDNQESVGGAFVILVFPAILFVIGCGIDRIQYKFKVNALKEAGICVIPKI